jgi:hypothetical protein
MGAVFKRHAVLAWVNSKPSYSPVTSRASSTHCISVLASAAGMTAAEARAMAPKLINIIRMPHQRGHPQGGSVLIDAMAFSLQKRWNLMYYQCDAAGTAIGEAVGRKGMGAVP